MKAATLEASRHPIADARLRIKPYLHETPILSCEALNERFNANIFFKAESLQKTGAFKVRGVLNHLLSLKEEGKLPGKIVAYSTGNHGIGSAWAAKKLGIKARIYLPQDTSPAKQQQAILYGAEVILTATRAEAEARTKEDGENGFYYLHPSDSDSTIAGAGTVCLEALQQVPVKIDTIFAACGGGGLLSGCFLAKQEFDPSIKLIGAEPALANDAYLSRQNGTIYRFTNSPTTIADGLRALGLSERTFNYIKQIDELELVSEEDISIWTLQLISSLKLLCEPSCAISMAAAANWLTRHSSSKNILVILSGGNIEPSLLAKLLI